MTRVDCTVTMVREYSLTMSTATPSTESSRERIITAAAQLFADRGYRGTTVADIQTACGMTPGSGALYKHFPSKRALLSAVIRRHETSLTVGGAQFRASEDGSPRARLELLVEEIWGAMRRDRDLLRVMLRDLDEAPELLEEIWSRIVAGVYDEFAQWLSAERDRGTVVVTDPRATAGVLLASLTYYPILEALIGRTPGDLGEDTYRTTWISHASAVLGLRGQS